MGRPSSHVGHSLRCETCGAVVSVDAPKLLADEIVALFGSQHDGHEIVETRAP